MVVLNKIKISNEVMEGRLVPGLQEKAPCVTEDLRLQEKGVVDFSGDFLHQILLSRETRVEGASVN